MTTKTINVTNPTKPGTFIWNMVGKKDYKFHPTITYLDAVKEIFYLGEEDNDQPFNVIRTSSLEELSMKFRLLMRELKPFREQYDALNKIDPLKPYYKAYFVSKEEFLAHIADLSKWLFTYGLCDLTPDEAMCIISRTFQIEENAFFNRFSSW